MTPPRCGPSVAQVWPDHASDGCGRCGPSPTGATPLTSVAPGVAEPRATPDPDTTPNGTPDTDHRPAPRTTHNPHRTHHRITTALTTITRWWHTTTTPPRDTTHGTRTPHTTHPPLTTEALTTRHDTTTTLTTWARHITHHRGLLANIDPHNPHHLAAWINTHAEWLAHTPHGPHAAKELAHCATRIKELATQTRPVIIRIAPCPEQTPEGETCDGTLAAIIRRGDALLPTNVHCDTNPHQHYWEPHEWVGLGRRLGHHIHPDGAWRLTTAINHPTPRT